ncbi:MAG: hypothetical protein NW217_02475 [Hyphomicrobiaceae bacterium]|nr:hypothetical protein [Hyphomicrobiaceae bacterium]
MAADLAEAHRAIALALRQIEALRDSDAGAIPGSASTTDLSAVAGHLGAAVGLLEPLLGQAASSPGATLAAGAARTSNAAAMGVFPTRTRLKDRVTSLPQLVVPEGREPDVSPVLDTAAPRVSSVIDELTRIRGIDAGLAQRLSTYGIKTIAQIAALTAADVRRMSADLGLDRRIARQSWIEQAAVLMRARPDPQGSEPAGTVHPPVLRDRDRAESSPAALQDLSDDAHGPRAIAERLAAAIASVRAQIVPKRVTPTPAAAAAAPALAPAPVANAAAGPSISDPAAAEARDGADVPLEADHRDDLTRIARIDAATATALSTLGVTRFAEIAQLRGVDIIEIDQQLGLRDRLLREQWIEQAAILAVGHSTAYASAQSKGHRLEITARPTPPLPPDPTLRALLDAAPRPQAVAVPADAGARPQEPPSSSDPPRSSLAARMSPERRIDGEPPAALLAAVEREIESVEAVTVPISAPDKALAAGTQFLVADAEPAGRQSEDAGLEPASDRAGTIALGDVHAEEAEVMIVDRPRATPQEPGETSMSKDGALGPPGSLKTRLRKAHAGEEMTEPETPYAYGHAIDEAAVEIVDVETRRPLPRRDVPASPAAQSHSGRRTGPRILRALSGRPPRPE